MLKDIDFGNLEVMCATKNINNIGDEKDIIVSITMVNKEYYNSQLTGIEKMEHEIDLSNTNKLICSYTTNHKSQILLPIKVVFRNSDECYSKKVFYEHELNPDIFEDLDFIEKFFDRTDDQLKRVFL